MEFESVTDIITLETLHDLHHINIPKQIIINNEITNKISPLTTFLLGSMSACIAESVVYPADMIKTRLQINNNNNNNIRNIKPGMFKTGYQIIKLDGIQGLYQGFTVACYRQFVYSGFRFLSYEIIRDNIKEYRNTNELSLFECSISAMLAGIIGQFIASPTDLLKVQMQTEGFRKLQGLPTLYNNSVFNCLKYNYNNLGFFGLWRGWFPNCQRSAFVQLGDIATYDYSKKFLLNNTNIFEDNYILHSCSSVIAGFVSTVMSTPSDVIKTRIMSNPHLYKGSMDCLLKTIKNEGFFALYKGFFPIWARMGPKSIVFYLSFEKLRGICGLNSW